MKGLPERPSQADWDAHYAFLHQPVPESPTQETLKTLARSIDYARLDPRSAELLVSRLILDWEKIPAPRLAEVVLAHTTWLHALGVILEFVQLGTRLAITGTPCSRPRQKALHLWCHSLLALCDLHPREGCEQFYLGNRAFASPAAQQDALLSLDPYLQWGYISQEVPFNKAARWQGKITLLPEKARKLRLREWLNSRRQQGNALAPPLTVAAYRAALGGWVSIRQAQLDLKNASGLRARGQTRGRRYRQSKSPAGT